jgi:hypothetical protein
MGNKKDGNNGLVWALAAAAVGGAAVVGYLYMTEDEGQWLEGYDAMKLKPGETPSPNKIPAPRIMTVTMKEENHMGGYVIGGTKDNGQAFKMTFSSVPNPQVLVLLEAMEVGKTYEISGTKDMLTMREIENPHKPDPAFKSKGPKNP